MPKKAAKKTVKKAAKRTATHITKNDSERDERIGDYMVDTYNDPWDRAMGWYYSLADALFDKVQCRCTKTRSMSPLAVGDEVAIVRMPPEEDCARELFVFVEWSGGRIAVPLNQLEPIDNTDESEDAVQVIEDWLYWCLMKYEF